jgi:S-formylglutathione hydrolase
MTSIVQESRNKCFGGYQLVVSHPSDTTHCTMRFAIFLPSGSAERRVPVVYFLSGLTCTEQNVITKAGAQQFCELHQVAFVCPDTSPRGEGVPDADATDLGTGAGFYVNATAQPWSRHYQMYDYVTSELPSLVEANFPVTDRRGIMGHSMGGHGALVIGLRESNRYRSVSAFSPICAPSLVPWGQKAFTAYLGADEAAWAAYDASRLMPMPRTTRQPLLIDVGDEDPFLTKQLHPEALEKAALQANHPLSLRRRVGYDHSYYFIATFIGEHIAHHAAALTS